MVHDAADVPEGPVNLDSVRVAFDESYPFHLVTLEAL